MKPWKYFGTASGAKCCWQAVSDGGGLLPWSMLEHKIQFKGLSLCPKTPLAQKQQAMLHWHGWCRKCCWGEAFPPVRPALWGLALHPISTACHSEVERRHHLLPPGTVLYIFFFSLLIQSNQQGVVEAWQIAVALPPPSLGARVWPSSGTCCSLPPSSFSFHSPAATFLYRQLVFVFRQVLPPPPLQEHSPPYRRTLALRAQNRDDLARQWLTCSSQTPV